MAFYKDLNGKNNRKDKQLQAQARGGFEDEGARYSRGKGGDRRPAGQGEGAPRYGKPAGGQGAPRYGRPAGQGEGAPRYGKPAGGQGEGAPRYGKPAGGQGRGGHPGEGAPRSGKPSGGRYDNRRPNDGGRQPERRYDERPRYQEDDRPVSFRDRPRATPQGERTFNQPSRDFTRNNTYRFSNKAPMRYSERGSGFTPPSYDEQRRAQGVEEPRYNSYRYAPPVRDELPMEDELIPNENLLSGRNPIREALKSGRDIEKLMVARGELSGSAREIVQMAKERHIPVQEVDRTRLDAITRNHQGMLAFASAYQYSTLEAMLELADERDEDPFIVLLDGITDPHNLGAVIRTAECAGAHGVIVQERRAVGLTPAAVKASAGAVEHVPVARVTNLTSTIQALKARNIWVYAADMSGADYSKTDFTGAVALVIGAEGEGVSRRVLESCDKAVSIPLKGQLDSLNASVAAGVLMYAVLQAR